MPKLKGITENLLNEGIDVRINTCGSSMFPLIRTGDKITVRQKNTYRIGDLVVFKRDQQMVCHRLVKVFERDSVRYFQTRGDSFFGLDEPLTAEQILGKAIRIERENVSLSRRFLLFIFPALKFGRLNAFLISTLIRIRKLLPSTQFSSNKIEK